MAEVKILIQGEHKNEGGILNAHSTVSLIKSENKNILVDTGSFGDKEKLLSALKKENLSPENIDIILSTHNHLDHNANINLFKNAKIYTKHSPYSKGAIFHANDNNVELMENIDNHQVTKDVKLILTPGHLESHFSVVVNTDKKIIVICGDAIQKQKHINETKKNVWDVREYEKSKKKILEITNYIILGHDKMYEVEK